MKGGDEVKELLSLIENCCLCKGFLEDDNTKSVAVDPNTEIAVHSPGTIVRHSVPKLLSDIQFEVSISFRSPDCQMIMPTSIVQEEKPCSPCSNASGVLMRSLRKKKKASSTPAKAKASLAACGPEKLRATVKSTTLQCKQLEDKLQELQTKIENDGVGISESLEKDLLKIMGGQNLEATPHMMFFWKQQMKLLQAEKMGRRYHPQTIRFALSLHGKPPAAYRELRDSAGALILPSERVLRDYKNYFKPKAGINNENVGCLREKAASFSGVRRYVALVMYEMKIQSNLVCF